MYSGKDLAFLIASREMSCKSRFDGDNAMRILVCSSKSNWKNQSISSGMKGEQATSRLWGK